MLSLEAVLAAVGGLLTIAFFLALAFFLVLGACVYAALRTWRDEHRYS